MIQRVPRVWLDEPISPLEAAPLAKALDLPLPIAEVMVRRGIRDIDDAEIFLDPRLERLTDPMRLPDMEKAVDRIWKALLGGENILVFGDYDVDGVTSTALLSKVLQGLGGVVSRYIPHRIDDGYGLSASVLRDCLEKYKPRLIVTVDCGTGSVEAVNAAKEAGVDVIVTDHHEASGEIADALALVNPKVGDAEDLHTLAGVGVAFKLCHALVKVGRRRNIPSSTRLDMRSLMHLVALGTVADMVPLVGENRILARFGIAVLNKRRSPGIDALARNAGVQQAMTSYHIGFVLGPRINAAGRMDSPETALNLLLAQSLHEAEPLAKILEDANKDRQLIEQTILEEAVAEIEEYYDSAIPGVLVVARRSWHQGVVGIVASRLVRRYHRPAIVISIGEDGTGRGSCRSIDGFDLITHLQATEQYLQQYGGHRMAAGLDIRESKIDAFREAISARAREAMAKADLRPRQHIDGWIQSEDLTERFMAAQDKLMPFGHQNTTPVWGMRNAKIKTWQVVGQGKHIRLVLDTPNGPRDAIGFGMGERDKPEGPVDLAFQLRRNFFRGEEKLQLMLQDFR
ncbi:MAG: single-stranded-DNA-specific exonuclease RecJ [Verrucomicrobia bacterium]|nr:single-stranded-DNA-specific exonuclease RecJ [Verrucomicrobiota bacterium]MCH8513998.1 single-stranded-DNA-specific exonuclease RecJ [Kiritimatiellia bacterium]